MLFHPSIHPIYPSIRLLYHFFFAFLYQTFLVQTLYRVLDARHVSLAHIFFLLSSMREAKIVNTDYSRKPWASPTWLGLRQGDSAEEMEESTEELQKAAACWLWGRAILRSELVPCARGAQTQPVRMRHGTHGQLHLSFFCWQPRDAST